MFHHCPLVAVTATAAPAHDDKSCDGSAATLRSVNSLNVTSDSRADVCDNRDPAKLYNLQTDVLNSY